MSPLLGSTALIQNFKFKIIQTELFPTIISYIFAHSEKSEINLTKQTFKFYI